MDEDVFYAGVAQQARLVRAGELSARELTDAVLDRVTEHDRSLNACTVVLAARAREEADARDEQRAARTPRRRHATRRW